MFKWLRKIFKKDAPALENVCAPYKLEPEREAVKTIYMKLPIVNSPKVSATLVGTEQGQPKITRYEYEQSPSADHNEDDFLARLVAVESTDISTTTFSPTVESGEGGDFAGAGASGEWADDSGKP